MIKNKEKAHLEALEKGRQIGLQEASYALAEALKKLGGKITVFDFDTVGTKPEVLAVRNLSNLSTEYVLKPHGKV